METDVAAEPAEPESDVVAFDEADAAVQPDGEDPAGASPAADIDAIDTLLDEVEGALGRIDAGTYGRCQQCGELIDDARLAGHPTARACDQCLLPPAE